MCRRRLATTFALSLLPMLLCLSTAMGAQSAYTFHGGDLLRIDLPQGPTTVVGPTGYEPTQLAFAPDGRLFAIDPHLDLLLVVDDATGAAQPVGNLGFDADPDYGGFYVAMAFDSHGQLWMSSQYDLYTVDTSTGSADFWISIQPDPYLWYPSAMTFQGGQLFVITDWLFSVDLETGVATQAQPGEHIQTAFIGLDTAANGAILGLYYKWWQFPPGGYHLTEMPLGQMPGPGTFHLALGSTWDYPEDLSGLAVKHTASGPAIDDTNVVGRFIYVFGLAALGVFLVARQRHVA